MEVKWRFQTMLNDAKKYVYLLIKHLYQGIIYGIR